MSFFKERRDFYGDPLYNPFERPSMPLASLALDGVLGTGQNNDSGQPVDVERGLALPTAYRCISIISTVLAGLTLEQIKVDGDAQRWDVLDNLNSQTAFECLELIGVRLGGWGNYYAKKVGRLGAWRGAGDTLRDLIVYRGGDVKVIRKRGVKTFRVTCRDEDTGQSTGVYEDIPDGPDCPIFHIPFLGFDGMQGVSPVLIGAQTFGTSLAADKLAARFYSRGQQLGGILKVKAPLANQSQADAMKLTWRHSHGGVHNAGDVAILDSETDFQAITIAPEALQFLQSREWQAWEVAKLFGIPAWMVQPNTTWGTGVESQNEGFVSYTMRSYSDRTEQRFTRDFGDPVNPYEFDLDRLLRGNMTERFQAYGQAIGWGWMQPAEARRKERMKSVKGLNFFITPQSMNGALADGPMNTPPSPNGTPSKPDSQDGSAPTDDDSQDGSARMFRPPISRMRRLIPHEDHE